MPIGDDPFNLDFNDGMWARQNVATKAKAWRVDSPFGRRQFTDRLSSHFSNEANGRNAPTAMQSKLRQQAHIRGAPSSRMFPAATL
jgi:hypothetical protein